MTRESTYSSRNTTSDSHGKSNGIVVGIDASRNRSGGAKAHLIGILRSFDPRLVGVSTVHVWSYAKLLAALPDKPWLVKHSPPELEKGILHQIRWQVRTLREQAVGLGCHVMLNTGAGTFNRFTPSITMSRDMLSFESGEMQRYPLFSRFRLRLFLIKHLQIYALKRASGAIFLTEYAARNLQEFTGNLAHYRIIPHGVGDSFRQTGKQGYWNGARHEIRCIYVSNIDLYKHQWNVVDAVSILRKKGHPVTIEFIGGGSGLGRKRFDEAINRNDPERVFTRLVEALPHEEIPGRLAESDIFIFASSCENMPNTLVEGMASSLPIACSDRGPMPEVLGAAGAYFDPERPSSIAEAIESLINDSERRELLAQRASEAAAAFSWERCSRETFSFLVDLARTHFKSKDSTAKESK